MRRLEASKNPPLWHDLLESLTAQVAFLLCDRKIGMLSRLLLLPIKLQQRFLSLLLLEHGRLPHQGLHDFVQRILSYSRQDDWILTELYLLHDKCIQFADVSCDCGLHVDSRWLLSSVETRCQAIEDKLNYGRVDSKWLTGWKRNVDQVMIIDNDSNAEECGEMEILFGGESVSSLSFKDSCLNYKEDEYDTTEIMLNDEDTESSILVKRRKINEESDHVVPTVSPDNDNNSQDTELSQKSLFSQATPTKLKLDKMQELQDEISMFESDCTLSVDMKKAVLKLRDDVLSGSALHSEMEDELEVILMKCHTRQVSDVCSKLKCSNLTESQFTYLANRMCRLKVEPSYQTCCQFMREAFLSWFLCLQQSASRAVVSVAERLAQKFLRPFLSSIAVPLMALDTLSKVQVELLSRVIRSSLSMDDQHELLREYLVFYLASNAVWSDGTVTVLCALVDTKVSWYTPVFVRLVTN
ncbi:uncharacterized protein LOC134188480 isoform X2 [Corticium candelabrum]|uniref:uncharacterized protein LOC134188480 isoform X2 n=1 Tax=Corticium candelabrum TaxID=121492 RepID=UPI002E26E157|nr:uncharacterized protein LOC134188480 isoform X2 [Corticium candelabrum]